jgi:cytochrome b561
MNTPVSSGNNAQRYHRLSIALHWFMALLLIAVYVTMEFRSIFPKGSDARSAMKMWHFMLGLSVLSLVIIRLAVRFTTTAPPILPTLPSWQLSLSKLIHLALYGFMLAMPIAGWLILSGEGARIPFFGLELPALIAPNKELAHQIEDIHGAVGEFFYYVIGLHVVAALFHHYFVKDNTLKRMLP